MRIYLKLLHSRRFLWAQNPNRIGDLCWEEERILLVLRSEKVNLQLKESYLLAARELTGLFNWKIVEI